MEHRAAFSAARRPDLPRLVVECWRNGPRWRSRLATLAEHYARQYQASPEEVYGQACGLTFDGEIREG